MGACCKLVQILLVGVCIALHYHSYEAKDEINLNVITGTYGLFAVILLGDLAASCASQTVPRQLELFYCLFGVVMFCACGIVNVTYFHGFWPNMLNNEDTITIGLLKGYASFVVAATYVMSFIGSCACVEKPPANSMMLV